MAAGPSHNSAVCKREPRLEQDELAVARDQKIDHALVAVAGLQSLAHEDAQIARERRVRIVDRLVLADHAAQLLGEHTRARLERSVGQDLVGLHGKGAGTGAASVSTTTMSLSHRIAIYSAGWSAALLRAGFGAPTRSRRSESDSAPPITITTAPSQISSTSGL